jgi:hypothetical protein
MNAAALLNPIPGAPPRGGRYNEPVANRNKWAMRHKVGKYSRRYNPEAKYGVLKQLAPSRQAGGLHAFGSGTQTSAKRRKTARPF